MTAEPFLLDAINNPHPAMRRRALEYRTRANITAELFSLTANLDLLVAQFGILVAWRSYLEAMCDATGCTPDDINAWLDREPAPL